ncbi:GAD-like domain-containing protein [Aureibacter tunicatorum]|uniref:GAD-like domain protein n=1 Tax=Aureibacter tunicatorum TaxID=866807 RepID=A0AAE3XS34_9BACT|nr:GAD-like domain-containing protein [Aureibacter tunicatorum]MDR6241743.1 hypothetical protein [Aureibacter tunicatorum]BDD07395.1 aspartyl-tRNA amidotransferase subunit B [Aureibacter tunicatorum]
MEKSYSDFLEIMGAPVYNEEVPDITLSKYKDLIKGPDDNHDIIIDIWENIGFSGYENGLFWIVNPDLYTDIVREFKEIDNRAIVFARTATGNLFLWEWVEVAKRPNIVHFNIHTRTKTYKSNSLDVFLNFDVTSNWLWEKDFYGKMEQNAVEKFKLIKHDEAAVFVPSLALGGEESRDNLQLQKLLPHLFILAQL